MAIEFIGMIAAEAKSEIHPPQGPVIDPDYIARFAQAHEAAGFDRVLIAHNSADADAVLVATHDEAWARAFPRVIALEEGRLIADGPPAAVFTAGLVRAVWAGSPA